MKAFLEKQRHSSCRRYSIEYKKVTYEDIFDNIIDKGHTDADFLTIVQGKGTVKRDDADRKLQFDKSKIKNYKYVKAGDLIIHMRSHQGGFEYSELNGVVSSAYTVLRAKPQLADSMYFKFWFRDPRFIASLSSIHTGLREGQSIKWNDFKKFEVNLPPLEHQILISSLLSSYDSLIDTVQSEQDSLMKIKSQLMTDIFS